MQFALQTASLYLQAPRYFAGAAAGAAAPAASGPAGIAPANRTAPSPLGQQQRDVAFRHRAAVLVVMHHPCRDDRQRIRLI